MSPTAPTVPARLIGVQSLRGLGVLLIILVHLHHAEGKYTQGPQWLGAWHAIGISGVDLFFVVSGFVLTYLGLGHFGSRAYVRSYAYARVSRVYPMYMLLTALLVPAYLVMPTMFNASEGHQVSVLRSLFLIPDVRLPLIPVAWTLHHELYFYAVFGLTLLLPERRLGAAMLAWLGVSVLLIWWGLQVPRPTQGAFERVLVNPINLEFIFGVAAAWALVRTRWGGGMACVWASAAWLVGACGLWLASTGRYELSDFWRVWVYGVPAGLFIYGISRVELDRGRVFWRGIAWIGDSAYSIYLSHLMVLVVCGKVWSWLGIGGALAHAVYLAGSVAIALGVGLALYHWLELPLLRWARRHDPTRRRAVTPGALA